MMPILLGTNWAPSSCKWNFNPYKWPCKSVTGAKTPIKRSYKPTSNWFLNCLVSSSLSEDMRGHRELLFSTHTQCMEDVPTFTIN